MTGNRSPLYDASQRRVVQPTSDAAEGRRDRPSRTERRALRTIARQFAGMTQACLTVVLPDGRRRTFGPETAEIRAHLDVHDWAFFRRILTGGSVGLGESYLAAEFTSPDLVAVIRAFVADREALGRITPTALVAAAGDLFLHLSRANRIGQSQQNIAAHYDLSNELYELFLDRTMTYSSAVFEYPGQPFEQAQLNKYRRLAEAARITSDSHVLEVGCGWGGFAEYAARTYGCRVTGITLSVEQLEYARERISDAGLDHLVDFQLIDYRLVDAPEGGYDRIVSIEMLEAVGHKYLPTYFATLDRVLADDGLVAIQVISIPEQRYASYRRRPDFIAKHVFPGGHIPSMEAITSAMKTSSDFYVEWADNISMDYAETLRRWREAFLANLDDVRALGFDDRFIRLWDLYLAYCEGGFRERYITDYQLLLTRPRNATLGDDVYGVDDPTTSRVGGDVALAAAALIAADLEGVA